MPVNTGDRIAQLILEQIRTVPAVEVDELDETVRGEGGFGSTGGFGPGAAEAAAEVVTEEVVMETETEVVPTETKTAPPPEPSS